MRAIHWALVLILAALLLRRPILHASADFLPYQSVPLVIVDGGRFTTNPTTEDRCGASDLEPVGLGPLSLGFATLPLQT